MSVYGDAIHRVSTISRNPRSIIFQQFINRIILLVFLHFTAEILPLLDENLPDFNLLFIRKIAS